MITKIGQYEIKEWRRIYLRLRRIAMMRLMETKDPAWESEIARLDGNWEEMNRELGRIYNLDSERVDMF